MTETAEFAKTLEAAKKHGTRTVDLQFIDIFGNIKFKTVSFDEFVHEQEYLQGYGVDGSSISSTTQRAPTHYPDHSIRPWTSLRQTASFARRSASTSTPITSPPNAPNHSNTVPAPPTLTLTCTCGCEAEA